MEKGLKEALNIAVNTEWLKKENDCERTDRNLMYEAFGNVGSAKH